MDPGTMTIIGVLALMGGVYCLLALVGRTKVPAANRPMIGVLAAVLLVGGAIGVGWINISGEQETTTQPQIIVQQPSTSTEFPEFSITPTTVTGGSYNSFTTLNSDETVFTVPAYANTTAHTIIQTDNSTAWADPRLSFSITPVPFASATADNLATIYFSVSNYDATVSTDSAVDQHLITKSNGKYQVIWSDGTNTWYVEGSKSMLMTGNLTLTLDFDVNQGGMSYMDAYDPIELTVNFHNQDYSWSESYTVSFVVTHSW